MKTKLMAVYISLALCGIMHAQIVNYVESTSGDLSGVATAPTVLDFAPGLNTVAGTMGRPAGGAIDRDIFTFHLENWEQVTSLNVLDYSPAATPGAIGSFLAISGSNTINLTNPSTHLSNILVSGTGEILSFLAAGSYSDSLGTQPHTLGLTAPLGAGDYTIWFQELSTPVNYRLGISVVAVPEPSTWGLIGAGFILLICFYHRNRRSVVLVQ